MAKRTALPTRPAPAESRDKSKKKGETPRPDGMRETIESIVIAFALAFLFRTFEAEGFEIPTGSMAPTLMGQHKDYNCPQCGFLYQVGASQETDQNTGRPTGNLINSGICPMCRYKADIGAGNPQDENYLTYAGDRIQAAKFTYFYDDPRRWDVTLFKYPHEAATNYIKRLVGLPNETLRIWHGDLFTRPLGQTGEPFTIARKSAEKVRATLQEVYDNDYVLDKLIERGWPARWKGLPAGETASPWQPLEGTRAFQLATPTAEPNWLVYEHTPPSWNNWQSLESGPLPAGTSARPQLITDFCGYNTGSESASGPPEPSYHDAVMNALGLHWVGDLEVETEIDVTSDQGEVLFELIEAGRHFRARVDLATGEAALSIDGAELAKARTSMQGAGEYTVSFANVDDQLLLWIDGDAIEFPNAVDGAVPYDASTQTLPTPDDLRPVRIGAANAALTVRHLKVRRDIYYIAYRAIQIGSGLEQVMNDYPDGSPLSGPVTEKTLREVMSDPARWSFFDQRLDATFDVAPDHFLMFGDNSGGSSDSRVWPYLYTRPPDPAMALVHRDLLIGKAMFVYWPHAWVTSWNVHIEFMGLNLRVPLYPNFKKFRMVR